jgi:hypothetical protein
MSVPDAWGLKYEEVVGLTWLAYKGQGTPGNWSFPNAGSTWNLVSVFERGSFRAVLVKGKKTVLSFSGTDDGADWGDNVGQGLTGISGQYAYALYIARSNASDLVVGHSLGGGLASYVAIYGGRQAATVNPAPLNINAASGLAMLKNNDLVVNYVAPGEALDLLDAAMLNMRRVGKIYNVPSTGGYSPVARHLLPNLSGFSAPVKV